MRNRQKWMAVFALILYAGCLAGCSLAQGDGWTGQDELAGVFVRCQPDGWENDNFFEYDAQAVTDYLRAHPSRLNGGEIALPDGLGQGVHILTDAERDQCLLFEWEEGEDGNGPYTARGFFAGSIFNALNQRVSVSDEGEAVEVSAAVYVDAAAIGENACIDIDPVYRRPDGILYVAPDSGFMGMIGRVTKTFSAETASTDSSGKKTKNSLKIEVSVETRTRVERAVLLEMDENNQAIASREIDLTGEKLVETVSPKTAWVLLEQRVTDMVWGEAPQERLERQLVSLENGKGHATLLLPAAHDGLLVLKELDVLYPGVNLDADI